MNDNTPAAHAGVLWRLAERSSLLTVAEREWLREALGRASLSSRQADRARQLMECAEKRSRLQSES